MSADSENKITVLVIEDEIHMRRMLNICLKGNGYRVVEASTGKEGISQALLCQPDVVLLDLGLPDGDGQEVLKRLREWSQTPIFVVSVRGHEDDKIAALDNGANDYITKPFSPRELVARVKAVLRRFETPLRPAIIRIGDLQIDSGAMELKVGGQIVPATATEFRLLEYLARHAGRVFTRDQLLDAVWRDTQYVTPRSVDVYVRRIREKIEPDAENPQLLKTVRGAGYRFEVPK